MGSDENQIIISSLRGKGCAGIRFSFKRSLKLHILSFCIRLVQTPRQNSTRETPFYLMHYDDVNECRSVYSSVATGTRMRYYIHRPLSFRWCTSWNLSEALVSPAANCKKKPEVPLFANVPSFPAKYDFLAHAFKQCESTAKTARGLVSSSRVASGVVCILISAKSTLIDLTINRRRE